MAVVEPGDRSYTYVLAFGEEHDVSRSNRRSKKIIEGSVMRLLSALDIHISTISSLTLVKLIWISNCQTILFVVYQ